MLIGLLRILSVLGGFFGVSVVCRWVVDGRAPLGMGEAFWLDRPWVLPLVVLLGLAIAERMFRKLNALATHRITDSSEPHGGSDAG